MRMYTTVQTIIPIFTVILLGVFARHKGFIPQAFLEPANRLVYYLAIPAMIFRSISGSSLGSELNPTVVVTTLACVPLAFVLAWGLNSMMGNTGGRSGTFIQCAFHGNLGYIGLAVIYYAMGDKGLVQGSIIAGFTMIVQNALGVLSLQLFAGNNGTGSRIRAFVSRILINPVILSALLGIGFAALKVPMPTILDRSLKILSGMALPMALLMIGASLSFSLVKIQFSGALATSLIKLVVLPALGLLAYRKLGIPPQNYLPGLILLAAPSATLTYVFAKEMHGDADLAVATISVATILSGVTYAFWLHWAG
jgi:malate permease and related proteins